MREPSVSQQMRATLTMRNGLPGTLHSWVLFCTAIVVMTLQAAKPADAVPRTRCYPVSFAAPRSGIREAGWTVTMARPSLCARLSALRRYRKPNQNWSRRRPPAPFLKTIIRRG